MSMTSKHCYLNNKKYTYDFFHQDNVCRLCWSTTKNIRSLKNDSLIAGKILEYIGIDVTTGTPNKVCTICLNKIKTFINFKKFCLEAEKKLKTILSKTFKDSNPIIIKNEADLELKLLAREVKKEKLDRLIIKEENDSKFETNDSCDYDDLLPKDDNYCYICSLNFESMEAVTKHNFDCHKITENIVYKCHGCQKEFTSFARKINHELHLCKNTNNFSCNICVKIFPTYELFESHMRAHEKSEQTKKPIYQCQKCLTIFKTGAVLRKHMLEHTREKSKGTKKEKFVCEVCGQMHSKSNMHVHMLIHTQYKQLKCPHCEYCATLQSSLNTHIKMHTGERPFACDQCPYRCITSSNLNKHRKTHTGVKEYTCHICKKGYRHNTSLRDHITSTHQGERKHKCKQCGAQYFHFKGLRKHMLTKHGQKVRKIKDDFIEVDRDTYTRSKSKKTESGMSHEGGMSHEKGGMGHEDGGMSNEDGGMSHDRGMSHEDGMVNEENRTGHGDGMGHEDRLGQENRMSHEVGMVHEAGMDQF